MKDFTRIPLRVDKFVLIDKASLADALYHFGVILAFFASLHPWFMWGTEIPQLVLETAVLAGSFLLRRTMHEKPAENSRAQSLFLAYALLTLCISFVNGRNLLGMLSTIVYCVYYFYLFRAGGDLLRRSLLLVSKIMAGLLAISMLAYMMFLTGRSFPSTSVVYGENLYSFTNYRLFMVAEHDMWTLIPRFQSVFLEPSHMAIAAVFLLMTDIGHWKRWYNVIMLVSVVVSFSVEAYVLLFCLFFFSKWILRKHFIRNLMLLGCIFSAIVIGSFFYNDGDNMLNRLIVARLEVEDGEVAGNNRTTASFDAEFESFLSSSDLLFGRELTERFGNSGYKVFLYDNGLISLVLLFVFYAVILYNPQNKRAAFTAFSLALIHFVVRAHMTWASCIIPMYYMAQWFRSPSLAKNDAADSTDITE